MNNKLISAMLASALSMAVVAQTNNVSDRALWASINGTKNASLGDYQQHTGKVLVSWRMLPGDNAATGFDLYRTIGTGEEEKIASDIRDRTCYQDATASKSDDNHYRLTLAGSTETLSRYTLSKAQVAGGLPYISIPLADTKDVYANTDRIVYTANDVSIGDLVSPGTKITTLDDISEIKVDFRVPEKYYPQVKSGQKVGVQTASFPNRIFSGSITAVSPRIDPVTRSAEVRATVPNPEGKLVPGMLFVVTLELGEHVSINVPEQALMSLGEIQYVFVYKPGQKRVERREIKLGQRSRGMAEILSGLKVGELLVVDGVLKLVDGAAVQVIPDDPPAKPAGKMDPRRKEAGK